MSTADGPGLNRRGEERNSDGLSENSPLQTANCQKIQEAYIIIIFFICFILFNILKFKSGIFIQEF